MADIVDMADYLGQKRARRGFGPWIQRFGETYAGKTRLSDLSDRTLYRLAAPGTDSTAACYELILGILNLGHGAAFDDLLRREQTTVVDIHLFFVDRVRFEMMRRLGWLEEPFCGQYRIVELVHGFQKIKDQCKDHPPQLSGSHTAYASYINLHDRDREAFIRRLLPAALESFQAQVKDG